ncbi:MAG: hypothetical protein V4450_07010 [Bacteroidota bacterium]
MKKLLLTTFAIVAFLSYTETKAQVHVNLNVNIGSRPNWGLPGNYAGNYYYLPEIDTYYDIAQRQFVYFDGRDWAFSYELPYAYRDYDLYGGYKVVINEPRPYLNCNVYRTRYSNYYNTYRRPAMVARGPVYRIGDDRNARGWNDDRFDRRRESDRDNRYSREDNDRRERDDRGRGNDHDNGHGWGRRGRG